MFYKFSNMTQNLNSATQDVAMGRHVTPQAFPSTASEGPKIYYDFKPVPAGPPETASARHGSSHSPASELGKGRYPVPNTSSYRKLMDMQTKFTHADGKLVWQKLPMDKPIFYLVAILCASGGAMAAWSLKKLATPPTNS